MLAFALPASLLLLGLVAGQRADPDLWGRISLGAVLFRAGHLPRIDDFSYTAAGRIWIDHEWLTGAVFYGVLAVLGEPGLQLFKYAALASALGLVLAAHRNIYRASPLLGAWTLALLSAGYLSAYVSTVRAQVFSVAGFLLFLFVLESVRLGHWRPRALWALLPAGVVWANLHGGFVMGLLAVLLYAGAELVEHRSRSAANHAGLGLLTLAAVGVVNPYGPAYLGFLLHAWTLDRSGITEWQPLLAGPWSVGKAYLAAILALAAGLATRAAWLAWVRGGAWPFSRTAEPGAPGSGPALAPALVVLLVVCMALLARRIHSFVSLTLAFTLPALVPSAKPPWSMRRPRLDLALGVWAPLAACVAAPLVLAIVLPARPVLRSFVPDEHSRGVESRFLYPVGAVRYLRNSPYEGRLLNPFTQGEFLYWTLYPRFRVAIDGRYEEVYPQEQFRWVRRFYGLRDPRRTPELADTSGADFILLRSRWAGGPTLARTATWVPLYDDGVYALLGRTRVIERHLPFPADGLRPLARPTIASFFRTADRERFAGYPTAASAHRTGDRDRADDAALRERAARRSAPAPLPATP